MQKKQLSNYPVWFDGTNINEAAFCEEFLHTHKILFANNAFFTPEGRIPYCKVKRKNHAAYQRLSAGSISRNYRKTDIR